LITDGGTLVRTRVDEISVVGRNTQGVTIIRLGKNEKVIGVDRIEGLAGIDDVEEDADLDSSLDANEVIIDEADLVSNADDEIDQE